MFYVLAPVSLWRPAFVLQWNLKYGYLALVKIYNLLHVYIYRPTYSLYIEVHKVKEHKMCHEWREQQTLCWSMRPASTTEHCSRSSWVFNALPRGRGENRATCAQVLPAASLNLILHGLVMSPFPKLFNLRLLSTPSPPSRLFKLHDESSCAIVINGALW